MISFPNKFNPIPTSVIGHMLEAIKEIPVNGIELDECLRIKKEVTGILRCNGKEDAKYEHASGCSCMTTCTYKFAPVMK